MKQKPRISRISVGRVYNLGNYEHVRFELTAEIPEGASASKAIVGLERIIEGMRPNRSIKSEADLKREADDIARMRAQSDEDFERYHQCSVGTRAQITARYEASLRRDIRDRKRALKKSAKARKLFDNLNGAEVFKDAKLDWEDNDL